MRIHVKLFAMLRESAGVDAMEIEVPDASVARDALAAVIAAHPSIERFAGRLAVALNLEYVALDHPLKDGDEIALIPPVSGG